MSDGEGERVFRVSGVVVLGDFSPLTGRVSGEVSVALYGSVDDSKDEFLGHGQGCGVDGGSAEDHEARGSLLGGEREGRRDARGGERWSGAVGEHYGPMLRHKPALHLLPCATP